MQAARPERSPLVHAAWIALFLAAFAQTFAWLFQRWTASVYLNAHGLFVPLVVGWLVWENLRDDPPRTPDASPLGFLLLVPGLALLVADSVLRSDLLAAVGLVLAIPGVSLLVLGLRRTWRLAFPFALLPLMLPLPFAWLRPLHYQLQLLSAQATAWVLEGVGRPTLRQDTILRTPFAEVEIAEACSGYSALYAAVVLALVLCYLGRSNARRALLLVCAPVIALSGNVLRSVGLVLAIERYGPGLLDTPIHELSGVIAFAVTLVALFLLAERRAVLGR